MAGKITNGIEEIRIGGEQLGLTEEDSFVINTTDNTTTQTFNVEEQDEPLMEVITGSKSLEFEFTIADPDAEALETLFNGTVDENDVTIAGVSYVLNNVSFELTPKMGWGINIDNATVTSTLSTNIGKNALMGIVVTVKPVGEIEFIDTDASGN